MDNDEHLKIEVVPEATDSGGDHQYSNDQTLVGEVRKEQTALSIIGLVLAVPFPVLIIILWATLNGIKDTNQVLGAGTINAVLLYLVQFFIVPVLSIVSVVIAFIVTIKPKQVAKKIGYISMGVTGAGLIILGLFLNHT